MQKLYIVMYHYVRDLAHSRYPHIKGLDLSLFRQQLSFLKSRFSIVTMEEALDALDGTSALPENAALLTFDDGYADHYAFALPVLQELGLQGSFFIPGKTFSTCQLLDVNKIHYILASAEMASLLRDLNERLDYYRGREFDYPSNADLFAQYAAANRFDAKETVFVKRILQTVLPEALRGRIASDLFQKHVGVSEEVLARELYMTEDQIRTLRRQGMFIGVHGYDHYWLGSLPAEEMRRDIAKALEVMEPFIDRRRWVMNYPYGSFNSGVTAYIAGCGCAMGLTTECRAACFPADSRYALPRLDCNDFPPKSENYQKL